MKFTSKGLGKRCLTIACGAETERVEGDRLLLAGTVGPPLSWAYTIAMDERDWIDLFATALHPVVLAYLARPRKLRVAAAAGFHLVRFLLVYTALLLAASLRRARPTHGRRTAAGRPVQ